MIPLAAFSSRKKDFLKKYTQFLDQVLHKLIEKSWTFYAFKNICTGVSGANPEIGIGHASPSVLLEKKFQLYSYLIINLY